MRGQMNLDIITRKKFEQASYLVVKTEQANYRAIQFYCNHGFRIQKETTMMISGKSVQLVRLELKLDR